MLEYIISGFLLTISVVIIMFVPHRLADFTIDILELIKPGVWYNNMQAKRANELKYQVTNLWGVIIFLLVVWCMLIHIYPALTSLIN